MANLSTNNPITADGTYDYNFNQFQDYKVEAYGDFGGGTLSIQTLNGTVILNNTAPFVYIFEPVGPLSFVLSGATTPSITVEIKSHESNQR